MPTQQKALLLPKKQGDWEVHTIEVPKPGPGQLLVLRFLSVSLLPLSLFTMGAPLDFPHLGRRMAAIVFGGANSVGQYAIRLAKLSGFSPIIATASLKNAILRKSLGATHVLDRNLSSDALLTEVGKLTNGTPVEVIYDAVSLPTTLDSAINAVAPGGTLIHVRPGPIEEAKKAAAQGKRVVGVMADVNAPDRKKTGQSLYAKLPALLESGANKPNPVELLPDGLAGIPGGLKRSQDGEG
ncbi:hypothetical protein OBBRIDRAFT_835630 [Obba rivulosa]|uniref:Alcohol dehydrogenase-like C-terminal domain-containing protein n=1 Tax=Obba rivulosa TaxID=1052685 RepID=A0A8E2ARN0_9APHY|nr:hypothetical protein OBBRIDRAFT_835630 [Obba rivulosa]